MKTIISLSILLMVAIASVASYKLFIDYRYDISALLTLCSIVTLFLSIFILSDKKISHC
jgi:hypothetical protein